MSAGCRTPEGCSSSFSAISPPPPELSDLGEVSPVLFPTGSTSETPRLSHPPWLAIAKPAPHARCQLLFILLLFSRWRHSEAAPGCCWELLRHRSVSCAMSTCSGSGYLCMQLIAGNHSQINVLFDFIHIARKGCVVFFYSSFSSSSSAIILKLWKIFLL